MSDKQLKDRAIDIKGKQYVLVSDRVNYLAENHEGEYAISTDVTFYEQSKMWVVRATLEYMGKIYNGHAQEIIGDGYINKTSALENAETSAVGRACAMAGIGVIDSIASVDEINKASARSSYKPKAKSFGKSIPASDKQKTLIRDLSKSKGANMEAVEEALKDMTIEKASQAIDKLNGGKQPEGSEEVLNF